MEIENASLKKVSKLTSFLTSKPDLSNLLGFLSLNISPIGDFCGASLKVQDKEQDRDVFSDQISYSFDIDSAGSLNVRIRRVSCAISLGQNLLLVLEFENSEYPENHEDVLLGIKYHEAYFECIQAILKFYLAFQSKKFQIELLESEKLSPRQLLIHKMMVTGKTNRQIASELSYSVSLIRQETMRIYSKLKIDGRKEIKRNQSANLGDLTDEITSNADKDE